MRIVKKDDLKTFVINESGEMIYEMIGSAAGIGGTSKHSFVHVEIIKGGSSFAHYHKLSEETYYILSGTARIVIDKKENMLTPGQACLITPGEVHRIFNVSSNNLVFLAISAPAWDPSDSYFV